MNKTIRIARKSIWTMLIIIIVFAALTVIVGVAGMKEVAKTKTVYERMLSCQATKYEAKIAELEAELTKASNAVNEAYTAGFNTAVHQAIPLGFDSDNNFQIQYLDTIENYSCDVQTIVESFLPFPIGR